MSTHSSLGLRVDGVMAQFTDASCWRSAAELELRAPWGLSDGSDLWEDGWMNDEPRFSQRSAPPLRPKLRVTVKNQRLISNNPTREEQMKGFRGWHERGYLPHRDEPGLTQFVTFRLTDSFPSELRHEWEALFKIEDDVERRTQLEAYLDLGHGSCPLKDERVAGAVAEALCFFDGQRYALRAFTIMPNHVHALFLVSSVPMSKVVQSWKRFTSNQANEILGQKGTFWQEDYWDTYMRDVEHESRTHRYIRDNPVKAGLVSDWKAWPWTYLAAEEI